MEINKDYEIIKTHCGSWILVLKDYRNNIYLEKFTKYEDLRDYLREGGINV